MLLRSPPPNIFGLEQTIDREPLIVAPNESVFDVINLMQLKSCHLVSISSSEQLETQRRSNCVLVMAGVELVGIFTERDVVRLIATSRPLAGVTVAEVMTRSVITLRLAEYQDVFAVLDVLSRHHIRHLPIVDEQNQLVGLVTLDTLRRVIQPAHLLRLLQVREAMNSDIIHAPPTATIGQLAQLMHQYQVSCVVIAEAESTPKSPDLSSPFPTSGLHPVGIITEWDLVQFQALELDLLTLEAHRVMSAPLFCMRPEDSLWSAHVQMQQRCVRRLVVTQPNGALVGIVTQTSILQALNPLELNKVIGALRQELDTKNLRLEQEAWQRQQLMQSLSESEARFRASEVKLNDVLNSANAAITSLRVFNDRTWVCNYRSGGYETIFGFSAEAFGLSSDFWMSRVVSDDLEALLRTFFESIFACRTTTFEYQFRHQDGTLRWISSTFTARQDDATNDWLVTILESDVTDYKLLELALRQSEAKLSDTLNSVIASICTFRVFPDRTWHYEYCSRGVESIFGYTPHELMSDPLLWPSRVPPEDVLLSSIPDQFEAIVAEQTFPFEYRFYHKNGSLRWLAGTMVSRQDERSDSWIVTIVEIDITDRKQAEAALQQLNQELEQRVQERTLELEQANQKLVAEITEREQVEAALRQNEEWIRIAVEAAGMGVWEWDLETGKQNWSAQSEILFGFAPGTYDRTTSTFWTRIHPDDREILAYAHDQALQTGYFQAEYRVVLPKHGVRWLVSRGRTSYDKTGKPLRLNGVDLDISDRKQAEEQIKASLQEKEVLLKEIHHRVKNNLQVISSLLRMQARRANDPQTAILFKESQNRVQSMSLIHEQLYQSSDFSHIDFGDYVRRLVSNLFRAYGTHAGTVAFSVTTHQLTLTLDAAIPCGLIINELVSNSLKYAFPDGHQGSIAITLQKDSSKSGRFVLSVSDNGIGIPDTLDWQATRSLGLRIVHNLVTQLDGSIKLDRTQGTTFIITFLNL